MIESNNPRRKRPRSFSKHHEVYVIGPSSHILDGESSTLNGIGRHANSVKAVGMTTRESQKPTWPTICERLRQELALGSSQVISGAQAIVYVVKRKRQRAIGQLEMCGLQVSRFERKGE